MNDPTPPSAPAPFIIIGPFTNVPAPGSPIRSDWPQQITNYILNTKGPGALVAAEWNPIANANTAVGGLKDLNTTALATVAYPTRVVTTVSLGMTSVGASSFQLDVFNLSTGSAFPATGTVYCQAGFWGYTSYTVTWAVAANVNPNAKYRVNVVGAGGGTVTTAGSYVHQMFVA